MQQRRRSVCGAGPTPSSASLTAPATTNSSWMSPRMRSNTTLRESSPDRGLAAVARLATCNAAAADGIVSRSRLSASGPVERNAVERCRRHSYHAPPGGVSGGLAGAVPGGLTGSGGSPPPPMRHAWRFTAATGPGGDVQSARSPVGESIAASAAVDASSPPLAKRDVPETAAADIAAGLVGSFSPVTGHRQMHRTTLSEAETPVSELKTPTAREDTRTTNFSFAPSPTQEATEATPVTRPRRLTRAHSALRACQRTEPQRAHSADPRRRKEKELDVSYDDARQQEALATCRRSSIQTRASDACLPTARDTGVVARERHVAGAGERVAAALAAPQALSPSNSLRRPAPFKSLPSTVFGGKYLPGRYLGRGASATVWEASHSDSNLRVAVKVFDQGSRDKRQAHREVRVLSRVQHPSILEAYEVIESTLYAQLVCELVDGESLRAFAQRQPAHRLQEGPCRRFYQQVVEGISYCHDKLVVHRDLKLENLLLDKGGDRVKIIDFGFATQVASRETKLRAFCGTPSYMAPEIVRGEGYSGFCTDVWALGVVLFALLCGALPFVGRTEMQLYAKIRRGTFICPDLLGEPPKRLVKSMLRLETLARPSASAVLRQPWISGDSRASECQISCLSPGRGCKSIDQQGAGHERARLADSSYARKDRSESPGLARRRFSSRGVALPATALGGS
mmetsp:Transcript_156965/g.273265  ORF Transcript_156965/g.273265 Transcript_156965/m.273265 type:complete len:684 (-) Transcript_156965:56-2107(-)